MKQVLKQKHANFAEMMANDRNLQFFVTLPQVDFKEFALDRGACATSDLPVSVIAATLFYNDDIIGAFKSLYSKYIDPNYASFMINIASNTRESLIHLLDCNYYQKQERMKAIDVSNGIGGGRLNFLMKIGSRNKVNVAAVIATGTDTNETAMIDIEWKRNNNSKEWLLQRLVSEMDVAALEIAALMNDAFSRFRRETFSS